MRINQFVKALVIKDKDVNMEYASSLLTDQELKVFMDLSPSERYHAVKVSEDTLKALEESCIFTEEAEKLALGKAALLHDVGKTVIPLNAFEKGIAVIASSLRTRKSGDYEGKWRILDSYYNHPHKGRMILEGLSSFENYTWMYDLISLHHREEEFKKKYPGREYEIFSIYKKADDAN